MSDIDTKDKKKPSFPVVGADSTVEGAEGVSEVLDVPDLDVPDAELVSDLEAMGVKVESVPENTYVMKVIEGGEWVDKACTKEEYEKWVALTRVVINEPQKTALDTSNYDPSMSYHWASVSDVNSIAHVSGKSYLPVRKTPQGNLIHTVQEVGDIGKVVKMGDAILFAKPKEMAIEARRREIAKLKADADPESIKRQIQEETTNKAMEISGREDIYTEVTEFSEKRIKNDPYGELGDLPAIKSMSDDDSYLQMELEAQRRLLSPERGSTKSVFGGFNGAMAQAVPESPYLRNVSREEAIAGL